MTVYKIAFTSCMNAERCPEQPVWDAIAAQKPDLLLLLGDQIYMDWGLASLARVPAVKEAWQVQPAKARQAFAEEMHGRYASQWAVSGFAELMCSMRGDRKLLLAWDDHDFGWNDSLGIACDDSLNTAEKGRNDKVMPDDLKAITWVLRQQFETVLREFDSKQPYPKLPDLPAPNSKPPLAVPPQTADLGDIPVLVLDQRWSRTDRDARPAATLLSASDRQTLIDAVSADKGLLVLAGSSPLKHRSLSGAHSSWWAEPDEAKSGHPNNRAYPEYADLVAARRPVLYLAGEIHRNAWGGPVEPGGPVVQALSSGAGLGRLLFHEYRGSFGIVVVDGAARDAKVLVELHSLKPDEPASTTSETHRFDIAGGKIVGRVDDGECSDDRLLTNPDAYLLALVDKQPLPVLAYRRLGRAFEKDSAPLLLPGQIDELGCTDDLPVVAGGNPAVDGAPFMADFPTALSAQGEGAGVRLRLLAGRDPQDGVWQAVDMAFARARQTSRSVVMFVHGFGKGTTAAITQAAELRERFNCEPVLYTWSTSGGDGPLGALGAFQAARKSARLSVKGLAAAVKIFSLRATENPDVPAVLVVRSLGAQALFELEAGIANLETWRLVRVLLSAPACDADKLEQWHEKFGNNLVITVNRNDRTLRLVGLPFGSDPLGYVPVHPVDKRLTYLDFTDVNGVGSSHDYLLRRLDPDLAAFNDRLVTGKDIDFKVHGVPKLIAYVDGKTYP